MGESVEKFVPEAYNLHKKAVVNEACEHGFIQYCYPKNSPTSGVIQFTVEGNNEHCILLNKSYVKMRYKITGKAKRTASSSTTEFDIGAAANLAKVGPINNILHSAFESVDVYLNQQASTKADRHYPYFAYYDTLATYGEHPLHTYFTLSGWQKDDSTAMDAADPKVDKSTMQKRLSAWNVNEKAYEGEFIGRICSPLFQQEKILPTQVTMNIVMKQAKHSFALMHEAGDFELQITDAVLMIQKVTVIQSIKESYIKLMEEGHPLHYTLETPTMNYYSLETGSSQFMRDDLFLGKIPKRIIVGMVETAAYHGAGDKNPFNFQHFDLNEIALYKDGMPYPNPILKMDFEKNIYAEAYHNFMKALGAAYSNSVPPIKKEEYAKGFALFCYNMAPDQSNTVTSASVLNMNSNVRLEMKFSKPLAKNVTLLVCGVFENFLEISKDRRVTVSL